MVIEEHQSYPVVGQARQFYGKLMTYYISKYIINSFPIQSSIFNLTMNDVLITDLQISNYRNFIDNYELLERYFSNILGDIYKYKSLSKEGIRQKSNRMERHNSLKKVMNYPAL